MAERARVLIVGVGVFGRLLAHELLRTTDADLVLAGRRRAALGAAAEDLNAPDRTETTVVDLNDLATLRSAVRGCAAVVCTAGPFHSLRADAPIAAVRAGAHWVDVSDDPDWVISHLRDDELGGAARAEGVAVIPGLSTVPALSGALARLAAHRLATATRARVTLAIGNRNEKGPAAIASALSGGLRDPVAVELPPPFGRRPAYLGRSPDAELLRDDLGLDSEFRVVLGWRPAALLASSLSRFSAPLNDRRRTRLSRVLSVVSTPFGWFGSSGGCLQVELWDDARRIGIAALSADQRLAILPCAMALERLLSGTSGIVGSVHPVRWLPEEVWERELRRRGVRLLGSRGYLAES